MDNKINSKKNINKIAIALIVAFIIIMFGTVIFINAKNISKKTLTSIVNTDIYVALYNDGTLIFNNKNEFDKDKIVKEYGQITYS